MMFIIGAAFCILLLFSGALRAITLGLFGLIGAGGVLLLAVFIWNGVNSNQAHQQTQFVQEGSAADYRAAQAAVARATGKPCDRACKMIIADQARVDEPQPAEPIAVAATGVPDAADRCLAIEEADEARRRAEDPTAPLPARTPSDSRCEAL